MKHGFDNEKYLKIQSERIKERIAKFGDKLYLEFGGKLFDDNHASRVLPGFKPDSKLQMLMQLSDCAEILFVISALDINSLFLGTGIVETKFLNSFAVAAGTLIHNHNTEAHRIAGAGTLQSDSNHIVIYLYWGAHCAAFDF